MSSRTPSLYGHALQRVFQLATVLVAGLGGAQTEPVAAAPSSAFMPADTIPSLEAFVRDGRLDEWRDLPPLFVIPASETRPAARVWLGVTADGLAVAAVVQTAGGPATGVPSPRQAALSPAGPLFTLHLATGTPLELPPVGFGNQFGFETLQSEDECVPLTAGGDQAECRRWFQHQLDYREQLRQLMHRAWEITPSRVRELVSSRALEGLPEEAREKASALVGGALPEASWSQVPGSGQAFEILIAWDAFPPVEGLELKQLRFAFEVGAAPGTVDEVSYKVLDLAMPRRYSLTPCRYGLQNVLIDNGPGIARRPTSSDARYLIQPGSSLDVRSVWVLDHETRGYLYFPEPTTLAPALYQATFFAHELGDDHWLCGPVIAAATSSEVSETIELTRSGGALGNAGADLILDSAEVHVRELPDGAFLVTEGPLVYYSAYGSGQCGACPRVSLEVYRLEREGLRLTPLFAYRTVDPWAGADEAGIEVQVSAAQDTISIWEWHAQTDTEAGRWSLERHCLDPGLDGYGLCEQSDTVPQPERILWRNRPRP